jgi:hypothetical protein
MSMPLSPMVTRVATLDLTESALPFAPVVAHQPSSHGFRTAIARGLRRLAAAIAPERPA